ncbi:MAG: lysophospholipid acyltransferase family protein [Acidimicrobiales bacterium]
MSGSGRSRRLTHPSFPFAAPTWPGSLERPAPERRVGLDFDHDWSRRYPVRLARAVVLDNVTRPLARVVAPTTVRGDEHLRHLDPPVIFAANHASHLDTPLLLTTLPVRFRHRTVVAAASDHFFDRRWKAVVWSFSLAAIPVERTRVNRRSADAAAGLLDEGWNLIIFPEGGRTPDGWAQPFRGGAAYLARRTGRPVVPVHLHGTRRVLPKSNESADRPPGGSGTEARGHGLRRSPVAVLFGTPITPDEGEDARRLGNRIEAAVETLADEVSTDWWTARRRAAGDGSPPIRGPEASPWRRAWALGPPPGDVGEGGAGSGHGGARPWPPT